jgi:hypothetical protein
MHLPQFEHFVGVAGLIGGSLLLAVLFVRHRARSFPVFTMWMVYGVLTNVLESFVSRIASHSTTTYTAWSLGFGDEIIQLFVFYGIAAHVFRPTGTWAPDVRRTFLGLISLSVLVALALAWLDNPLAPRALSIFKLRSDFFSSVLMSELFVISVALSVTYGLPWKTHVARIAQGIGAYSLVCLAADIARNFIGVSSEHRAIRTALMDCESSAWVLCVSYWIVLLWAQAPAPRELPEEMRNQIYTLQRQVENDLRRIRAWGRR